MQSIICLALSKCAYLLLLSSFQLNLDFLLGFQALSMNGGFRAQMSAGALNFWSLLRRKTHQLDT